MIKELDFVKSEEFGVGIVTGMETKLVKHKDAPNGEYNQKRVTIQFPTKKTARLYYTTNENTSICDLPFVKITGAEFVSCIEDILGVNSCKTCENGATNPIPDVCKICKDYNKWEAPHKPV